MEQTQLPLTDDDVLEAKRMFNWRYWYETALFSTAALGLAVAAAATRDHGARLVMLCLWIIFAALALVNVFPRVREYNAFNSDLEMRIAQSALAAPQKVWKPKYFFCYVRINGEKIRLEWKHYVDLREANLVRIVFLPTSRVASRIEVAHGLGIL